MSVSCSTFPTATSTNVLTTVTETTTTSLSVTTQPPETAVTISVSSCSINLPVVSNILCQPSTVSLTNTIPGAVSTAQVPFTITSTITSTDLVTLFATSCTTIDTSVNTQNTPPPTISSQDQIPSVTPVSSNTPIATPSEISVQPSTTQSSTSTTVQLVTTGTSSQASTTIATDNHSKSSSDVAPIVGGTVGGFFGLIAIVALIWFILRRRQRWDDIFEKEEDDIITAGARGAHRPARFSLDVDPEPKPYQYGLVGHAVAPSAASPPHSPPMRPSLSPGADLHNARRSSLMPLNPVASNLTLSSSTGSQNPLYPPQQGYTQQGYQQGHAPPLPNKRSMDWGTTSNSANLTHSHSASTASFMSPPISHAHWTGDVGPGYNGGVTMTMPIGMGMDAPVMTFDDNTLTNRSGSPTSIQETRRLQVTNANPDEFEFGESSSSAAAAAAAAAVAAAVSSKDKKHRDGKGRFVTRSSAPPIVHVDGGRLNVEPVVSGPQPPAYTD